MKKESGGIHVLPVVAADRDGHRLGSALGCQHVFALLRRQSAPDAVGLATASAWCTPGMVDTAVATLRDAGANPDRIHDEDFSGYQ